MAVGGVAGVETEAGRAGRSRTPWQESVQAYRPHTPNFWKQTATFWRFEARFVICLRCDLGYLDCSEPLISIRMKSEVRPVPGAGGAETPGDAMAGSGYFPQPSSAQAHLPKGLARLTPASRVRHLRVFFLPPTPAFAAVVSPRPPT